MKKILYMLLAVMLILAMAVPAWAVTPKWDYHAPKIPEVKPSIKIPDKVFDDWFQAHPLIIKIGCTAGK